MDDTLYWLIGIGVWIGLQRWVLPRFGIHTCMSPKSSCMSRTKDTENNTVNKIEVEEIKTPEV